MDLNCTLSIFVFHLFTAIVEHDQTLNSFYSLHLYQTPQNSLLAFNKCHVFLHHYFEKWNKSRWRREVLFSLSSLLSVRDHVRFRRRNSFYAILFAIFSLQNINKTLNTENQTSELRSFTSHKCIISGMKMYFCFCHFNGNGKNGRCDPEMMGFQPAHKHYCATRQSTFTNHWPISDILHFFYVKKKYFSSYDNVIACIFVTDSAGHRVTHCGKHEMSRSSSLWKTAPVRKMWRHIAI